MPSIILTGHPCIGKTTFAHLLAQRALLHPSNLITNVVHVSEVTACRDQTKAQCYQNSHNEKISRAALKSEFDRVSTMSGGNTPNGHNGETLIILDSLNYIKGFRYELFCISKAVGAKHGVIWIMGSNSDEDFHQLNLSHSDQLALKRNTERKKLITSNDGDEHDGCYDDSEIMVDLIRRYEPPDERNRWENPLYKINLETVLPWGRNGTIDTFDIVDECDNYGNDQLINQMQTVHIDNSFGKSIPSKNNEPKKTASAFKRNKKNVNKHMRSSSISTSMVGDAPSGPVSIASRNLATSSETGPKKVFHTKRKMIEDIIDEILNSFLMSTQPLSEGLSTLTHISSESNMLNQIDHITQLLNNEVLKVHTKALGRISIDLVCSGHHSTQSINLLRPLTAVDLINFRRQFLKWIAGHPMPDGSTEEVIASTYISYIESHL